MIAFGQSAQTTQSFLHEQYRTLAHSNFLSGLHLEAGTLQYTQRRRSCGVDGHSDLNSNGTVVVMVMEISWYFSEGLISVDNFSVCSDGGHILPQPNEYCCHRNLSNLVIFLHWGSRFRHQTSTETVKPLHHKPAYCYIFGGLTISVFPVGGHIFYPNPTTTVVACM